MGRRVGRQLVCLLFRHAVAVVSRIQADFLYNMYGGKVMTDDGGCVTQCGASACACVCGKKKIQPFSGGQLSAVSMRSSSSALSFR